MSRRRQRQFTQFLLCRTFGHSWFVIPGEVGQLGGDPLWARCERCDTERHDAISFSTGEVMSRHYVYPLGYRDAFRNEGDAPPRRDDYRVMLVSEME